jgi:ABC-type antimicrobial peptide transport system permease subunit
VLGLYQAGRRRRYEYAALLAGRVPRRSLRSSVFIEQAVVLGFGVIAGVAAGLGAAALVLRNLPEFTVAPVAPPLTYTPPTAQLAVPVIAIIVALGVIAALAAAALVRSARAELLRETQP